MYKEDTQVKTVKIFGGIAKWEAGKRGWWECALLIINQFFSSLLWTAVGGGDGGWERFSCLCGHHRHHRLLHHHHYFSIWHNNENSPHHYITLDYLQFSGVVYYVEVSIPKSNLGFSSRTPCRGTPPPFLLISWKWWHVIIKVIYSFCISSYLRV